MPDLSLDAVLHYRCEPRTGRMDPQPFARSSLAPGAGPRHFAYAPDGLHAYVLNELDSTVSGFAITPNVCWESIDTISVIPAGVALDNLCADIHVSPNGLSVYASDRGHDSLAVLSRDPVSGRLALNTCVAAGGRTPRSFTLDPSGSHLIVANQNSDTLKLFLRSLDGRLIPSVETFAVGTPMCVKSIPVLA